MPEGDKTTQGGAPAPGPAAPQGGNTGTGAAPTGLGAEGGGGPQAPAQGAGTATATQPSPAGTQTQPTIGGWTQEQRQSHYQTLYEQKALPKIKELEAQIEALRADKAQPPQPQSTRHAPTAHESAGAPTADALEQLYEQTRRGSDDTYLAVVREQFGETEALREIARRGILPVNAPTPTAQPQPVQQIDPNEIRRIAAEVYATEDQRGANFQRRLQGFVGDKGGQGWLDAEIVVQTPQGVQRMTREDAAHRFRHFMRENGMPVEDPEAIFERVDPAGMRDYRMAIARREWEVRVRQLHQSGELVIGQSGAPVVPSTEPGMATPGAILSDDLTRTAVASSKYGTDVSKKPVFAQGK